MNDAFQDGRARSEPLRIALRVLSVELDDKIPEDATTDREIYEALKEEYGDLIRLAREYGSF